MAYLILSSYNTMVLFWNRPFGTSHRFLAMEMLYPDGSLFECWQRARQGDTQAAAALLEHCRDFLRKTIHGSITNLARRTCDSDDLLQETLMGMLTKAEEGVTWESAEKFCWAIRQLAHDCTVNANRRAGSKKRGGNLTQLPMTGSNHPESPQFLEDILAVDDIAWLKRHISESAALVLDLRLCHWTLADIANRMNCHERTVSKYIKEICRAHVRMTRRLAPPAIIV